MRLAVPAALLAVFLVATPALHAQEPTDSRAERQLLVMSDVHFDPMATPRLVDRLAAATPGDWRGILDGAGPGFGSYGKDTAWPLLRSAVAAMRQTLPHPDLVVLPGDFLAHHYRDAFNAAAIDHSDAAYRGFVRKTIQFQALEFEHAFPATPILPVLGNNDDDCGDYQLQPKGPFLADTLPVLRGLLGNAGLEPGFERDWTSYGNASVKVNGFRILLADTIVFSRNYRDACGPPPAVDPGHATLAWLETELAAARRAHEPVWLVYHIPPGIDGYATWRQGSCPDHVIPMWKESYAEAFAALLKRYADTVAAQFAEHTHMDDFRLLGDAGGNFGFVLITPALSPIFGQNPAFRTVAYDRAGGILDETTYDLTDLPQAGASAAPKWQSEYTFTQAWGLPRVDLPNLERLYTMIATQPQERERWRRLFAVSSPVYWRMSSDQPVAIRAYGCATGHTSAAAFAACWCGAADR
jgi:hypothetical protein